MADVTFRRGVEANLPTSGMATEGCVYQSTDTGNMYVGSSQGTLIPVNRSPYYGTCPTQSGTNAKVVTLDVDNDNFTMKAGVMISVLFSNANTAASPTLNVNGKGAVSVKVYGTTNVNASPRAWEAGEVVTFVHNGTYWMIVGRNVQSDWNQTDTAAVDFIKNKPTNVSAFTNDSDFAVDANVVHKTGDETVGGTKTFNNNVVLGINSNLVLGTAQDEGVYIEANSSSGGQQALTFSSLDDDSAVRLENIAAPTANTDAANKQYVDDAVGNTYVSLNGVADTYGIQQQSLCAFAFTAYPTSMAMTSFTTSGGTGSKTPITDRWFPIGCKIYYHDGDTQFTGSFTSKKFYSTYNGVDARYSSVTGTNISLSSTKAVYLMVEVSENGFWKPYYKSGETNEIIVTDTISAGHFYIYLGRTIGSTGYMFQLEDNNPLYACIMDGSGTHLVDWASYMSSNSGNTPYLAKAITLFPSSSFPIGQNPVIGGSGTYSRMSYLDGSYLAGRYKVSLQLHAWWDYPKGTLDTPQPLSVIVKHNTNDKIAGGTFVIPVIESPNDSNYEMGTLVVNLVGFVTFTSAQTINDYIEVKVQGAKGINLGGEHPLWGGNEGDVEYNDGLILERVDWYNPS